MEYWINTYDFFNERKYEIGSGLTLFEDWIGIQDKSGRRGPIFFENSGLEIQDKNSPKRTYLVNIRIGNVPYIGSVVSHVKFPSIILLNKIDLV